MALLGRAILLLSRVAVATLLGTGHASAGTMPKHAVGTPQFWMCENGYRRECIKIYVPEHA